MLFFANKLPPLVGKLSASDRASFNMWGSDTFFCPAPCRTAERVLGLQFQKFHEPRHDFLSFAQPVFEAVETFGGDLAAGFR